MPQFVETGAIEFEAGFLGNDPACGQYRYVLQHGLAAIAEPRRFYGARLDHAAQRIDHQSRQRFALDFFSDHQQGLAGFRHLFQHRKQVCDRGDFFIVDQHIGVFQDRALLFHVIDEIGRQKTTIELHAFDDLQFARQA